MKFGLHGIHDQVQLVLVWKLSQEDRQVESRWYYFCTPNTAIVNSLS